MVLPHLVVIRELAALWHQYQLLVLVLAVKHFLLVENLLHLGSLLDHLDHLNLTYLNKIRVN